MKKNILIGVLILALLLSLVYGIYWKLMAMKQMAVADKQFRIAQESHKVAMKQMKHGGGMLSYEMKDGLKAGIDFMNKLKMCVRTVSLGTAESILCHPASMTHAGTPKESREKYGITDGLIRMSVGLENVEDILNDLEQALK